MVLLGRMAVVTELPLGVGLHGGAVGYDNRVRVLARELTSVDHN